jgi:hypothetical protein
MRSYHDIEALGPDAYDTMSSYQRRMAGVCATLLKGSVITVNELSRKMAEVGPRGDALRSRHARSRVADMELVAVANAPDHADQRDDEDQGDCRKCRVNQDTILPLVSRANFAVKNLSG